MLVLQIIFTVLSALCLFALLPAGTFGGLPYFLSFAGAAIIFFLLMLLCKKIRTKKEPQENEPDFLNPNTSNENSQEK